MYVHVQAELEEAERRKNEKEMKEAAKKALRRSRKAFRKLNSCYMLNMHESCW